MTKLTVSLEEILDWSIYGGGIGIARWRFLLKYLGYSGEEFCDYNRNHRVAIGDIAIILGPSDAWSCVKCLADTPEVRRALVRALLPTVRRAAAYAANANAASFAAQVAAYAAASAASASASAAAEEACTACACASLAAVHAVADEDAYPATEEYASAYTTAADDERKAQVNDLVTEFGLSK